MTMFRTSHRGFFLIIWVFLIINGLYYFSQSSRSTKIDGIIRGRPESDPYLASRKVFNEFLAKILAVNPNNNNLTLANGGTENLVYNSKSETEFSSPALLTYLNMDSEAVEALRRSHARAIEAIPDINPLSLYEGRGIVMTGNAKYAVVLLSAIKFARDRGVKLPIEVFIRGEEYDESFCSYLLPALGAKCVVLEVKLGFVLNQFNLSGYALKSLSILASSFREVIFLDADIYAFAELEAVLDEEPFKSSGFVLFPDYWLRTTSPLFYDIIETPLKPKSGDTREMKDIPIWELEGALDLKTTSESGVIFIDKGIHFNDLALAVYYNLYGPEYYYKLIYIGAPGVGDKDTFVLAAHALQKPYYQVRTEVRTFGYVEDGKFKGVAFSQGNPHYDYLKYSLGKNVEVPPLFIHQNNFKLNAKYNFDEEHIHDRYPRITQKRIFGERDLATKLAGLPADADIELMIFESALYVTRDLAPKHVPVDWQGEDIPNLSAKMSAHVEWLKANKS